MINNRKKILIFAPFYLPAVKGGGPIKSISNIVENLSDYYDFYIVTSDRDLNDEKPFSNIIFNVWNENHNCNIMYLNTNGYKIKNLFKIMTSQKFDYIYLNSLFNYKYSILPIFIKKIGRIDLNIVMAPRGELDLGALNIKKNKKNLYLKFSKLFGIYNNVIWHATSDLEKQNILCNIKKIKSVHVIKNLNSSVKYEFNSRKIKKRGEVKLVFISRISEKKNLLFALESLQGVKGDVVFDIFGPTEDKNYWSKCQSVIQSLPQNIIVNYKGVIQNNEVPNILNNYHCFYLPTKGENYGHAIVESLLAKCPILISDQTPWNNLESKNIGWDFPLDDIKSFTDKINELMNMEQYDYDYMQMSIENFITKNLTNEEEIFKYYHLFK